MFAEPLPALVRRGLTFGSRLAVAGPDGDWSYAALAARAARLAGLLLDGRQDTDEARVALLSPPGAAYVAGQWGTWMAGGVSVPLSPQQTPLEWEFILDDSQAAAAIVDAEYADAFGPLAAARHLRIIPAGAPGHDLRSGETDWARLPCVGPARRALMLYTSGTTSRPKGVVLTHASLQAQVECLSEAWEWRASDRALHVLPLNHTHGVINVLACALWNGAVCEFANGFSPADTWRRLASGDGHRVHGGAHDLQPPDCGLARGVRGRAGRRGRRARQACGSSCAGPRRCRCPCSRSGARSRGTRCSSATA